MNCPSLMAAPLFWAGAASAAAAAALGHDRLPHTLDVADANAWLEGIIPYALQSADIPGAVVVVVKNGQVLTERGFGYAEIETQKLVDPKSTLFRAGGVQTGRDASRGWLARLNALLVSVATLVIVFEVFALHLIGWSVDF